MNKSLPRYYWDTSIFIMLLQGEICHGQDTLDAARDIFQRCERDEVIIIASEIVVAEILPSKNPPEVFEKWEACLQWESMHLRAVDHPIVVRAARLRSDCIKKRPKVVIELADAIHVATYQVYSSQVDELHSVDPDFEKALKYSGDTRAVTKPRREQTTMEIELFSEEPDALGVGAEEVTDEQGVGEIDKPSATETSFDAGDNPASLLGSEVGNGPQGEGMAGPAAQAGATEEEKGA